MDADAIYEIARFRRDEDSDELVGRIQIIAGADGSLKLRHADGRETPCASADPGVIIAADAGLHAISPYEVTQLQGRADVIDQLPLLLRVQDEGHPPESYEVFVEDDRWDVLQTTAGMRAVPEGYQIDDDATLPTDWAVVSFTEEASRAAGQSIARLGLITPRVAAELYQPAGDDLRLTLLPRGDDAETITNWLINGEFSGAVHPDDELSARARSARSLVENAVAAVGAGADHLLRLHLSDDVIRAVLDRLSGAIAAGG